MKAYCSVFHEVIPKNFIEFVVYTNDEGAVTHAHAPELDMPEAALQLMYNANVKPLLVEYAQLLEYAFVAMSIATSQDSFDMYFRTEASAYFKKADSSSSIPVHSYISDPLKYAIAKYFWSNQAEIFSFFLLMCFPENEATAAVLNYEFPFPPLWRQFVRTPHRNFRKYCRYKMLQANDFELLTLIRKQLWSTAIEDLSDALFWIDAYRDEWSFYRLQQLTLHRSKGIRIAAIKAIGNLRIAESIPVLFKIRMENEDNDIGREVAIAFQKLDDARVFNLKWKEPILPPGKPAIPLSFQPIFRLPIRFFPTKQYDYFVFDEQIELANALNNLHTYAPAAATEILQKCLQIDKNQLFIVACMLIGARNETSLLKDLTQILPKLKSTDLREATQILVITNTLKALQYEKAPLIALVVDTYNRGEWSNHTEKWLLLSKIVHNQVRLTDTTKIFEEFLENMPERFNLLQIAMLMDPNIVILLLEKWAQRLQYTRIAKNELLQAIVKLGDARTLPLLADMLKKAIDKEDAETIKKYINQIMP